MSTQAASVLTAALSFVSTMFAAVIAYLVARINATANKQNTKLSNIAETADKTHTLVNSNMGAQLNLTAIATRRLANITKDKLDEESAKIAENLLLDHEKKQKIIDAKALAAKMEN